MDRTQWAIAPYTEADLQSQVDKAEKLYGAVGKQVVDDVNRVRRRHQRTTSPRRMLEPAKLPAEYAAFGKTPQPWKVTDVIATASLIGGIFGKGGGRRGDSRARACRRSRSGSARRRAAGRGRASARRTIPRRRPRSPSASHTRPGRRS